MKVISPIVFDSDESESEDSQMETTNSFSMNSLNETNDSQSADSNITIPPLIGHNTGSIETSHTNPVLAPNNSFLTAHSDFEDNTFEITEPEFIESRRFTLVEKKSSNLLKKKRNYIFMKGGEKINEILLQSLANGRVELTNDVSMYIRKERKEFVFKSADGEKKSLSHVLFSIPLSGEHCQRKSVIRFGHATGGMLPHKIVSLPECDDSVFNGHFYIESKRNVAFAVVNTSEPVLTVRQIRDDSIEIDTTLNLNLSILFGIAIALYVGRNPPPCDNSIDNPKKMHIFRVPSYINKV